MTKPSPQPTPEVDSHVTGTPIEILRVGRFTDTGGREHEFTAADLADIAGSYDPRVGHAPLVLGHPEVNGPAYGWVQSLRVDGDRLVALSDQVDPKFAEAVNAGRWKKRSASFYPKTARNNPTPGKAYLRHVGFLGAAVPACTGLGDFNFAADEDCIEFADIAGNYNTPRWAFGGIADLFRSLRDRLIETDGIEKANTLIPSYQIDSIREAAAAPQPMPRSYAAPQGTADIIQQEPVMTDKTDKTADFADRETKLTADAAALATREKALADREAKAVRDDTVSFADGLVSAGQLLPKDKTTVVELMLALPIDAPISFADGDDQVVKPATELFRDFLSGLPKQIEFSERSADTGDADSAYSFAAPQGSLVDAGQMELHRKALAYQAQHAGTPFIAAVKAVGG